MKIKMAVIFLVLASIACGTQMPTVPSTEVKAPSDDVSLPVKVAEAVEPTESPVIYVTTAPLNVRSEANADSTILGTLEAGQEIVIFIPLPEIKGDDCYTGEWLAIDKPIAGFVCSLYIQEKK